VKHAVGIVVIVVIFVVVAVLGGAFYVVNEAQQVVITMFGDPVGEPITTPGLKLKIPIFQTAHFFDKRFLEWDGNPNQITTQDKRFIWVDAYARWRITDPLQFFVRLRDERGAQSRLDDIIDGETRNTIAKHELIEVVRTSNRAFIAASDLPEGTETEVPTEIKFGRSELQAEVLLAAQARAADFGIEILDFRFKRINYEEGVRGEVYQRMISERKRIAEQYRSEGAGEAARINGDKDRQLKSITSEAYRQAQEIRGKADAEAADIYAKAYNKDAEFYRFLKTMDVYRDTIGTDTILLLGTDGEFLRYLESAK
jgi:membrane protease subunit HflC